MEITSGGYTDEPNMTLNQWMSRYLEYRKAIGLKEISAQGMQEREEHPLSHTAVKRVSNIIENALESALAQGFVQRNMAYQITPGHPADHGAKGERSPVPGRSGTLPKVCEEPQIFQPPLRPYQQ